MGVVPSQHGRNLGNYRFLAEVLVQKVNNGWGLDVLTMRHP